MKLVSQAANVPLFNFIDTALGYGSVGGCMTQIEAMAKKTGEIALRVLSGEGISAIEPAVIRENPSMFDWRELKRWGINESDLPPGSIVRFKDNSLWDVYRWWVIGAFAFLCLQTVLISVLVNNLIRRKRAEEQTSRFRTQLARMSRVTTVGQLGQSLAHEINQPLAAIRVNAEAAQKLLEEERPDLTEVHAALGDIVADNQRAQEVIVCIRNLVKNKPPEPVRLDLNRVATDAVLVVQADAASKGVGIHLELEANLPAVLGDTVQLQQVVLNFLLNAVDSVSQSQSPQRLVKVKTARDADRRVSLCVSDTGPGISAEVVKKLFEPFFTTKPQGLGLGLSICRSIAEAHGGSLSFGSSLERGAVFCLHLPVG
jgi:signal transduction histidine kinase